MNRESTVKIIRSHFENVQEDGSAVVRAEKRREGKTMSVHYFDFSEAAAKEDFSLKNYLQHSFASDFYKNEGSLQWNYYLYFVFDKVNFARISGTPKLRQIESDRTFARKFVKEQAQLNEDLNAPFVQALKVGKVSLDIASVWTEQLKNAGLDTVADPTVEYAKAVRDYLDGTTEKTKRAVTPPPAVANGRFIQHLSWSQFREYPQPHNFTFGTVNLIRGVNGSGKTSLLEAVELCICGNIRRQNGKTPRAKLEILYRGATAPEQCPSKNLQIYQSRDQSWFGGYTRRGNTLFNNFGRFNFFDSDAAFQLSSSDEAANIQKAINTLLLGELANRIEERMASFTERFSREQRDAERLLRIRNESVRTSTQQLEKLKEIKDTRPVLTEELKSKGETCGWKKVPGKPTLSDLAGLQEGVDGTRSAFDQIREDLWWMGRISSASVATQLETTSGAIKEVEALREKANANATALEKATNELEGLESEITVLKRLLEYHNDENGMALRGSGKALEEARARVSRLEEATQLLRSVDMSPYAATRLNSAALTEQQANELREAQRSIRGLQSRLQPLQTRLGQLNSIIEEIKGLGLQFCELSPHAQDCPLCGAHYQNLSAKLAELDLTAPSEESLRDLTQQLTLAQQRMTKAERDLEIVSKVVQAGELVLGQEKAATCRIEVIVSRLDKLSEELVAARAHQRELRMVLTELKAAGFEEDELEKLIEMAHAEYSLAITTITNKNTLVLVFNKRTQRKDELQKSHRETEKTLAQVRSQIEQIYTRCFGDTEVEDQEVELERRKEALEDATGQLKELKKRVVIADEEGFATVEKRLASFSKAAERILLAFRGIEEKDALEQQLTSTLAVAQDEVKRLTPRHSRAKKAVELLDRLRGDDYKEKYLKQLRAEHSEKISKIFCNIHAPHEFKSVVLDDTVSLQRLNGSVSQVSEISAGQRAALALSIFLSLNSSVTPRAPWLLFDDPVVHVDDLNVLSFFDTLRDLVLLNDRQVFFATASGRVADIFARKFDFLATDFRSIEIRR